MHSSRNYLIILISALLLTLGGCASQQVEPGDGAGGQQAGAESGAAGGAEGGAGAQAQGGASASAAQGAQGFQGDPLNDPDSPLSKRVFYFEFDSSQVSDEDREALTAHAEYLAAHPETTAVLEGHADERGSREYNLALGERRAKAVERILLLLGANQDQLQVISFGEERPVALGHDEESWRLNRRVELLYSGY